MRLSLAGRGSILGDAQNASSSFLENDGGLGGRAGELADGGAMGRTEPVRRGAGELSGSLPALTPVLELSFGPGRLTVARHELVGLDLKKSLIRVLEHVGLRTDDRRGLGKRRTELSPNLCFGGLAGRETARVDFSAARASER